jgi:hypothetical protein
MVGSALVRSRVWLTIVTIANFCVAIANAAVPPTADHPWRALHLINVGSDAALEKIADQLPELVKLGINCLMVEVDYSYAFESHPELRQGESPITKAGAKAFRAACDKNGIELVPQFQCLGHQSWKEHTGPLLTKYPEFDLTPDAFPNNKGIYCREWDPLNPKTNQIVLPLIDELIDAFDAKAFHVGMDEVFLLASDKAPSTKGHDPADVFAKTVNDLHDHIVGQRGLTMLMWADRLIDGKQLNMGEWEASKVGTAAAVDKIPKDIILCPWHYELRDRYESLPMFVDKGFRILPASWKKTDATLALIREEQSDQKDGLIVGHIFTTWSQHRGDWGDFEPLTKGLELLNSSSDTK